MSRCPYFDCGRDLGAARGAHACPACRRHLRICGACQAESRRLASFCRSCGVPLADDADDWTGVGGGPERRSLSRFSLQSFAGAEAAALDSIRLDDACAGLLFYDGYFVAVSQSGQVEVVDLADPRRRVRLATHLRLHTKPCIHRSRLLLADDRQLIALSLASLEAKEPALELGWTLPLGGIPRQSPLCSGNRLFFTLRQPDGQEALVTVDGIGGQPTGYRTVALAQRWSGLVAAPGQPLVALAERQGRIHLLRLPLDKAAAPAEKVLDRLAGGFAEHLPLAAVGKKIFAVLGSGDQLCRLDDQGNFEMALRDDVLGFALSGLHEGLAVGPLGLHFLRGDHFEKLATGLRVAGQPLILRDAAAVVGLQDGRLRLHDLANPPAFRELRVGDASEGISVLAAAREYLAAGGTAGSVQLFRLAGPAGRAA